MSNEGIRVDTLVVTLTSSLLGRKNARKRERKRNPKTRASTSITICRVPLASPSAVPLALRVRPLIVLFAARRHCAYGGVIGTVPRHQGTQRARRSATMHLHITKQPTVLFFIESALAPMASDISRAHHRAPGYQACRGLVSPPSLPPHCIISGETLEPLAPVLSALQLGAHELKSSQAKSSEPPKSSQAKSTSKPSQAKSPPSQVKPSHLQVKSKPVRHMEPLPKMVSERCAPSAPPDRLSDRWGVHSGMHSTPSARECMRVEHALYYE